MKRSLEEERGIAIFLEERLVLKERIATLSAALESKDKVIAELVEALEELKSRSEFTVTFYHKNGPTWTTPGGNEYENTSDVILSAEERIELIDAALSKAKQGDE